MSIKPSSPEMADALASFGRDLLLLEDKSLGAKQISFTVLIAKATSWLSSQETTLQKILCTEKHGVKPEITLGISLAATVAQAIRAHYGDSFPANSASQALMVYGLNKFCSEQPSRPD